MGADGTMWETLYMPRTERDVPEWDKDNVIRLGCLRMSGREVFRFAVTKFQEVIEEALAATGLTVDDISQFVCHQSNQRIIDAAKVTRSALQNAASIAALFLTTEAVIADEPEAMPAMPGGGMDDF